MKPAPFLRWAGGKRRLLDVIAASLPASYDRFYEPFLGGGTVFFNVDVPGERCVVNDVNPELVVTYQVLRDEPEALIEALTALAADTSKEAYYRVRAAAPTGRIERAARMIYLNRLCFNGLWRVNGSGQFNVPYANLKNPTVVNADLLRANAARLAGTTIREGDAAAAVADAAPGDFVYFDPPYVPLSPTAAFSRYTKDDFLEPQQRELAMTIATMVERGVHVMLSNSDTPLTRAIYGDCGLTMHTVAVSRSIAASSGSRTRVNEILGVSYPTSAMADPSLFTPAA
jgi:DNA adenine methylase